MINLGLFSVLSAVLLSFSASIPQHSRVWVQTDPQAAAEAEAGTVDCASAAWWGFDPVDATDALQAAIDSGVKQLVVPYMGAPWNIRPVMLRSDLEIIFEPGVMVLAQKGAFKGKGDSLFTAVNKQNITLRGYGARLRMHKSDYQSDAYEKAEWRMTLDFMGCSNLHIEGLSLENSGGDGIYLGATQEQPWCQDVVIRDVLCWNHHRQGISVISAVNLLIENCTLVGTRGTAPEAGIDLEPNSAEEKLTNVIVRNCTMANNNGTGILVYLKPMRATTEPVSILFENCHVRSGRDQGLAVGAVGDDGPQGVIEFRNCTVENTQKGGAFVYDKSASSAAVRFVNCKFKNVACGGKRGKPGVPLLITLMRDSITRKHGGIHFEECVVYDDRERAVLKTEEDKGERGAGNISGRIFRNGPGEGYSEITPESTDCSLEIVSVTE